MGKCCPEPVGEGKKGLDTGFERTNGQKQEGGTLGKPVTYLQDLGLTPEPGLNVLGRGWALLGW